MNDTVSDLEMESVRDTVPAPITIFVDEELEFGADMSIRGMSLYDSYKHWCYDNAAPLYSFVKFKTYLLNNYPIKFSSRDFVNVRLK